MALEIHSAADSWAGATEPGPRGCLSRWQQHRSEAHRQVLRGHAVVGVEGGDKAQMVQKKRQCGLRRRLPAGAGEGGKPEPLLHLQDTQGWLTVEKLQFKFS